MKKRRSYRTAQKILSILLVLVLLLQPQIFAYGEEAAVGVFDDGENLVNMTPVSGETPGGTPNPSLENQSGEKTNLISGETPGEGGNPTPGETPGEGGNPTPGETPGEGGNPTPGETPGEGENPTPGETPGEGENPTPGETPGEGENPTPGETPGEGENPTPGETPGEGENPTPEETPEISLPSDGSLAGFGIWFSDVNWKENGLGNMQAVFAGGTGEPIPVEMTAKGNGLYVAIIPEGDYSTVLFQTWRETGQQENLLTSGPVDVEPSGQWTDLTEPWNYYGQEGEGINSVQFVPGTMDTFYYETGNEAGYWGPRPETEPVYPSDGSLAGQTLKFVNLYWETNDMGSVEAVFDGGNQEPCAQVMNRLDRGVYETVIPSGDYSGVSFRYEGNDTAFINSSYNIYGNSADKERNVVSFIPEHNNTFYYDLGQTPSYWSSDPNYEALSPKEPVKLPSTETSQNPGNDFAGAPGAPGGPGAGAPEDQVSKAPEVTETVPEAGKPVPGQMVYFIDLYGVEQAAGGNPMAEENAHKPIERVHIAFLKQGHRATPDVNAEGTGEDGVAYTMYEKREGVYIAPFPNRVETYSEIAFQPIGEDGKEAVTMTHHYNFRGEKDPGTEATKKWGHFQYQAGNVDAFFLNRSQEDSFWGAHPSVADPSLDTKVLYVDASDQNGNGIRPDLENLWIKWVNMPQGNETPQGNEEQETLGEYAPGKGYKITKTTTNKNVLYFQFPYNSNATENTVLTLTFTLKSDSEKENPYPDQQLTFKMMYVDRGNRNCLFLDNVWQFDEEMFGKFEATQVEQETRQVFFDNTDTRFQTIEMRTSAEETSWDEPSEWEELGEVPAASEFYKENLFMKEVPVDQKYVQFKGTASDGKTYYSNRETISTEVSYPCYYAFITGAPSGEAPKEDTENPGITGYWRSVHSIDTAGDESIDIPTDTFQKEEGVYYANTDFYDYYSNWEMSGRKIQEWDNNDGAKGYRTQAQIFNHAAEYYYQSVTTGWDEDKKNAFKALYLTTPDEDTQNYKNPFTGALYWQSITQENQNQWTKAGGGPKQGLVSSVSSGTICTNDGVELPFFNEDFLRGNNILETAVGNVYKNVLFPFTKDITEGSRTYGYWNFDSARAKDAVRLSEDVDDGFFLKRTEEPLHYKGLNEFFPFNDQGTFVGTKLGEIADNDKERAKVNNLFGTKFEIDFRLTENAEIYNEFKKEREAIKFEFQGDDDVWIYVDGILALDLGGVHDAVRGQINFQEGTYTIWRSIKGSNGEYNGQGIVFDEGKLKTELIHELEDRDKQHRITIFYMERGLYESNLKISFNFPRQNTFSVAKEVDIAANKEEEQPDIFQYYLDNMGSFPFEIRNLVTSGKELPVEESSGYIKPGPSVPLYFGGTKPKSVGFSDNGAGTVAEEAGVYKVTHKANISGTVPKEADLLQITPNSPLDISKMEYLRLGMKNTGANDISASRLYVSLIDEKGNRVGEYVGAIGYDGENNTFISQEDSVIRVDFRQMRGDSDFDWSKVNKMLIGVRRPGQWADASYEISSIRFMGKTSENPIPGFSVEEDKISDYGSFESGKLTPVDQAWYMKKTKTGGRYNTGVSRSTDNGEFTLANGQMAVFTDKFRTGSYLSLTEKNVDPKIFDTSWTVKENGEEIDGKYLLSTRDDMVSVKNPEDLLANRPYPLTNVPGTRSEDKKDITVYDGREEILSADWEKRGTFEQPDLKTTLLYRGYRDPDNSLNEATDIKVEVKNTLKRGSITITKKLKSEEGKNPTPGTYTFDIYYTDIAGMGLESQKVPDEDGYRYVKQTVTVKVGESGEGSTTVGNIPAGTTYYIVERPSNGARLVDLEIGASTGELHEHVQILNKKDEGENQDCSKAYATGTAYAGDQEFIFTNKNEAFHMDVEKVWEDGMTDEERAELGISQVYIQLQRRTLGGEEGSGTESQWEDVTGKYFSGENIEERDRTVYIKLALANGWKATSDQSLVLTDDAGNAYEYRIQEKDLDGKLKEYQVSYEEEESPDSQGEKYHITYRAVNTAVGLQIKKEWDDRDDIAGIRPDKIRVKLMASSEWNPEIQETDSRELEISENQKPGEPQTDPWVCYRALSGENPAGHVCTDECFLELNGDEGWKKVLTGLPAKDKEGNLYYYKLEAEELHYVYEGDEQWIPVEQDPYDYQASYGAPVQPDAEKTAILTVKNPLPLGNLTIIKREEGKETSSLQGAEFKVERLLEESDTEASKLQVDPRFQPRTGITSATGRLEFKDLPYGTYKITETKAPEGYLPLKEPVYVTISDQAFQLQAEQHKEDPEYNPGTKTITITVHNKKYLKLPESGGKGTWMFTLAGASILGAALLLYKKMLNDRRKSGLRRKK